ncbi:hypothetical protein BGZ73_009051 [Actinomortierella ambigua]|nr:hypothetical protein BGZ73_009051 [Actinomortierella ambigua]
MHHKSCMDLPELRSMVAHHLSGHDLRACALVCKAWHETFTSQLWLKFEISNKISYAFCRSSTTSGQRDAIIKNSHRIRRLRMYGVGETHETRRLLELFVSNCTSLVAFTYVVPSYEWIQKEISNDDLVHELIMLNPGLQRLLTSAVSCLQPPQLSTLSYLRVLEICPELSVHDAIIILAKLQSLHDLTLYKSFSPHNRLSPNTSDHDQMQLSSSSLSSPSPSSSLQRLTLCVARDVSNLAYFLEQCPNLGHLCFKFMRRGHHSAIGVLRPGLLPHLNSLSLNNDNNETDIPMIVEALRSQSVKNFNFRNLSRSGLLSFAQYHAQRVERLILTTPYTEDRSLAVVLTQFPSLRILKVSTVGGDHIDLRHLINEPWKCTLLEELELPIKLDRPYPVYYLERVAADANEDLAKTFEMTEWQQVEAVFMKRLGSLTRLRRLELKSSIKPLLEPSSGMSWQLTTGLGHLQQLGRLETLKLIFYEYVQGIPEFQWMKQHFKNLSTLVVYDIGDNNKREWMSKYWPELCVVEMAVTTPSYFTL